MKKTTRELRFPRLLGLALLTAALLLSACSKKETASAAADPNAPVELTIWCWDPNFNVYAMNEALKIYQREKPNVRARVLDVTEIEQKLTTALASGETGELPDIVLNQDNSIQRFLQTYPEAYLPLNGKVDLSQFAKFKLDVGASGYLPRQNRPLDKKSKAR